MRQVDDRVIFREAADNDAGPLHRLGPADEDPREARSDDRLVEVHDHQLGVARAGRHEEAGIATGRSGWSAGSTRTVMT